jgi:NADPH-dependent 2,4-dienoyl-CoA reductase/sulfur reductase-like enzyme/nitrite reductase/ring-hydroxylating ferredoxin subunit
MAEAQELTGPDFTEGVALQDLTEGEPLLGQANGEAVMLVRRGGEVLAIGATCSHYGGPLAEGKVDGDKVYCPWHHACFSLRTGEALEAPALNPVARWEVEVSDGRARVVGREDADPLADRGRTVEGPESVVIVGGGAAGSAAAEMLRREGYGGPITVVDPEEMAPYDRPNLSKDYLAGNAPEEWIPLRPDGFYEAHGIDRVQARAETLDPVAHTLRLDDGRTLEYGALLLATGARPRRLDIPGADRPHVHVLRSLDDSRRIIDTAEGARRAVVVGSSFIGMEAAASLRQRELDVEVVSLEAIPFARTLGEEVGGYLRGVHEAHGVQFHPERTVEEIGEGNVRLDDGTEIEADLVVFGVGVEPETGLAEAAGLEVDGGVVVDEGLRTSADDVYAAGDIARYPDPRSGRQVRVEHWAHAQRTGQAAAKSILGTGEAFGAPPFFWTQQFDAGITYVGHAPEWDETRIEGDPAHGDGVVRLLADGQELATVAVGRDAESLEAQVRYRTP